jgi:hypothetical protein
MLLNRLPPVVLLTLALLAGAAAALSARAAEPAAESIDAIESAQLQKYLAELRAGGAGRAASVELLADVSFDGLKQIIEAYVALDEPVEPHTHRAFQALLERTSRLALAPWPLVSLYSPELAQFLVAPPAENRLAEQLCDRLLTAGGERRAVDLAVRLTPQATLARMASRKPAAGAARIALLEAWNRRLARAPERRPIASLDKLVATICHSFTPRSPAEQEASLQFQGSWPAQRKAYRAALRIYLRSDNPSFVLAALAVQQRIPAELESNEALLSRFADQAPIVQAALRNYAFDAAHDHSAILRRLWATLKSDDERARYNCLFAMGAHPRGNDAIALQAVIDSPYAFVDVAMPVLEQGDPQLARKAIEHVLNHSNRGFEEALRLAARMQLDGFEQQAVRMAADKNFDQILRQAAMQYLQLADGKWRRELMFMLTAANADLRLTAIQMFGRPSGLSQQDREEIGPALIRVAQDDASMGHRQEAVHVLGNWREAKAAEFFRTVLAAHPAASPAERHQGDRYYWDYRLRLVALLALAKLDDRSARDELIELHRQGGPVERMDVLLAFRELGEVPPGVWDDLNSIEPKLVATAEQLIITHGDAAAKKRLRSFFRRSPLWLEFADSGLDDHNILEAAGLGEHDAAH